MEKHNTKQNVNEGMRPCSSAGFPHSHLELVTRAPGHILQARLRACLGAHLKVQMLSVWSWAHSFCVREA